MRFVVLLRAVNVGGVKLAMADLRELLEGLGLTDVRTYLQSGNAVVEAADEATSPQTLATAVEVRIQRDVGPRVGVLVLPGESLARVVAANPFASVGATEGEAGEGTLHATFLFGSADGEADFGEASAAAYSAVYETAFRRLDLPTEGGEEAAFVGVPPLAAPVVYLKLPRGYGRTKLNTAFFERKLGTAATARNWRTVLALSEMAGSDG